MTPTRDAEHAFELIRDYFANHVQHYKYVCVKVARYETGQDFDTFKPGQQLDAYSEAIALLGKMCEDSGWTFDDRNVLTKKAFDDFAHQHGLIGEMSEKIDFVLTVLGHEVHNGVHQAAYGLSPLVALFSSKPNFLPQDTMHSGYVIPS